MKLSTYVFKHFNLLHQITLYQAVAECLQLEMLLLCSMFAKQVTVISPIW